MKIKKIANKKTINKIIDYSIDIDEYYGNLRKRIKYLV